MKIFKAMWRIFVLTGILALPLGAGENPYGDWGSWSQHYSDYVLESAEYWVSNRTSQILLGSLLLAQPVLWKTDAITSRRIRNAAVLNDPFMRFGEAWGRMYGVTLLISVSVFRALQVSSDKTRDYQQLEYVLTGYGTTLAFAGSLKYLVGRTRPDGSNHYSFPSGHTTLAFATAEMTRQLYGNGWGSAAYALAILTGIERIQDKRHWLGDVVTAAILSTTIARSLAPGKVESSTLGDQQLALPKSGTPMFTLVWHFPRALPAIHFTP
ncbi:MAG: phosphatase PAP2 family protein [Candidatus Marinimicrobia bacterium]|nr:phosphatase PAP2 family protein [Candidatus Neomarinimicrobiota bacterium]